MSYTNLATLGNILTSKDNPGIKETADSANLIVPPLISPFENLLAASYPLYADET